MMGGGLQRAYGAAKGHAFAGKIVDGTEVCIYCEVTVESCARRKTRCQGPSAAEGGERRAE